MPAVEQYSLAALHDLLRSPSECPRFSAGRGVVISGGGSYLPSSYLAVRSLRASGCTLPIQLWHVGSKEFPAPLHELFMRFGVEPVDSLSFPEATRFKSLAGFQNKPFSIFMSPFQQVLSIDADNIALRDPTFLFDDQNFASSGAIFWPDFLTATPQYWSIKPGAWELLGLSPRQDAENETGQLLIDKQRCWQAMLVTLHMNQHSDFYYTHCSYGDKDTYTLAWDLTNMSAFRIPRRPVLAGDMVRYQFGPDGAPLFLHGRKWVLPSGKNPSTDWFMNEPQCRAWLQEFEEHLRSVTPR